MLTRKIHPGLALVMALLSTQAAFTMPSGEEDDGKLGRSSQSAPAKSDDSAPVREMGALVLSSPGQRGGGAGDGQVTAFAPQVRMANLSDIFETAGQRIFPFGYFRSPRDAKSTVFFVLSVDTNAGRKLAGLKLPYVKKEGKYIVMPGEKLLFSFPLAVGGASDYALESIHPEYGGMFELAFDSGSTRTLSIKKPEDAQRFLNEKQTAASLAALNAINQDFLPTLRLQLSEIGAGYLEGLDLFGV